VRYPARGALAAWTSEGDPFQNPVVDLRPVPAQDPLPVLADHLREGDNGLQAAADRGLVPALQVVLGQLDRLVGERVERQPPPVGPCGGKPTDAGRSASRAAACLAVRFSGRFNQA
jgi:hypothetical protein